MRKCDFSRLKAGQRVVVNGTQDCADFENEAGFIVKVDTDGVLGTRVMVRFDEWEDGHCGFDEEVPDDGDRYWYFYKNDCEGYTITVEKKTKGPSTFLNGLEALDQSKGTFVTAWEDADGDLTQTDLYGTPHKTKLEADKEANDLAVEHPGKTVVVLRVVSRHTSSVVVTAVAA